MNDDTDLGARLAGLVGDLDLPSVDLRDAVLADVSTHDPTSHRTRRLVLVAAAVAAIAIGVTLSFGSSREAVASWLGIGSTSVRLVPDEELPAGGPRSWGPEVPVPSGGSPLPNLGEPDAVFRDDRGVTTFAWQAGDDLPAMGDTGWGAALSVGLRGGSAGDIKLLAQDERVEFVDVGGSTGLWIPGDHIVVVPGQPPAIAHRVLLWVLDGTEYRLETELPEASALGLAAEVDGTVGG